MTAFFYCVNVKWSKKFNSKTIKKDLCTPRWFLTKDLEKHKLFVWYTQLKNCLIKVKPNIQ